MTSTMNQDKEAPTADRTTRDKKIILTHTWNGTFAQFENSGETLASFHGWNSRRQIYFHLTRKGYDSKNIEYGAGF